MSHYKITLVDISKIKKSIKIGIVTADFNKHYTDALEEKNMNFLTTQWFENIKTFRVPWAFEIPAFTKKLLKTEKYDLILTFWVVIRWDTPHFDYVCNECSRWLMNLSIKFETPLIFWLLTCNTEEQVQVRIWENYAISWLNLLAETKKI